ncbi:MAG: DUF3604 domain-containing protein [Pseudomonadota bacterium]
MHNPLMADVEIGTGLVAVKSPALERGAIFDALFARRAYATSGDRILLDVRYGAFEMGDEVSDGGPFSLSISVDGTTDIKTIQVLNDGKVVHEVSPSSISAQVSWTEAQQARPGKTTAYWVRVIQDNNEEAVSSPIWWTPV